MIHEEQVRQLCAIHTVNNLLQLPADLDYDSCGISDSICKEDTNDEVTNGCKQTNKVIHEWACHGRIIRQIIQSSDDDINSPSVDMTPHESAGIDTTNYAKQNIIWKAATKEEFDNIAKELTIREQMLMSGDESTLVSDISINKETSTIRQSKATKLNNLSLMQQIRSPYGSPYFGNYSLDVIKEALKRRDVELEFYRVSDEIDITTLYNDINEKDTRDHNDDTPTSKSCNKCLLGFVIYEKEENQRSALSVLSRIGSHIPVVKNFCGIGQHWYAITGVQYQQIRTSEKNDDTNKGKEDTNDSSWYIIDSKIRDISTLDTDNELVEHLKAIEKKGALVFRAFVKSSG